MKKVYIYLLTLVVVGCMFTACSDDMLDTAPSTQMSGSELLSSADKAMVPLNGIYRAMYSTGWSVGGNTHQASSYIHHVLMADVMGEDHIMKAQGSGWFWYDCIYNVKSRYTSKSWRSYDVWNAYYKLVSNANYILASEATMQGESAKIKNVMGQAYAIRAFSYFMLVQNFARTYKGHEQDPGLPIYTEPTLPETEGQPRSTVAKVYEQIEADIDKAVELLKGTERIHISHIDYAVALGLQARIAMTMEKWDKMKTAATTAIEATEANIKKPEDILKGMNDQSLSNVMWGSEIIADQSSQWASFFTHMDASAEKYGARARKTINTELYAEMSIKDIRRAWWNPDDKAAAYQQEKFKFKGNPKDWMGDYIWMRVEEMYLMKAEAECRLNDDASAQKTLVNLVKTRDADYKCEKTGTEMGKLTSEKTNSLLEEIIKQRRIELWGEYGRIYDIRRLRQGFKRTEAMGWPKAALIEKTETQDPESYAWVLTIPQSEFDGNKNMDEKKDQNPTGDRP